ncbi:MAG: hypothetical protein RKE49_01600 [Oceanicaulis sp.]
MRIDLEGLSHADRDALKAVLAPCLEAAGLDPRAGDGDVTRLQAPPEDGVLLIGYSTPGAHVARGLYYAVEPDPALAEWSAAADAACRLADADPARVALVDVDLAGSDPQRALAALGLRAGAAFDAALAGAPPVRAAAMIQPAAERWARSRPGAAERLESLDASALTAGMRRKPMDHEAFVSVARIFMDASAGGGAAEIEALSAALDLCRRDVAALEAAGGRADGQPGNYPVPAVITGASASARDTLVKRAYRRARRSADLKLIKESGFFDAAWYVQRYPDAARVGVDPAMHYLLHGGFEGRPAGPNFNSHLYLQHNPDIAASKINPLVHFLRFGRKEGRKAIDINGQPVGGEADSPT